jgi:hypothetical protein
MTFARVWPAGLTFNAPPGSANLTQLDLNASRAVDGYAGGTYAPTSLITIGGDGLSVTGPFNTDTAEVIRVSTSLTILLGATLQLTGNQVVNSGAAVGILSGAFITVSSGGTLTMNAGSTGTFAGTNTLSGATTISGALTCSNTVALNGATTQTGKLTKSGVSAYTVERVNEISNVQPAVTLDHSYDVHYVHSPTSAGTTVYTIDNSTLPIPLSGERMSVHAYVIGAGKDVDIIREDATIIATIADGGGGGSGGVDLQFMFGRWRCVGAWGTAGVITAY